MPRRGLNAEYRVRDLFHRRGILVVRAAGSRGPVDLVVIEPNRVRLIQVKKAGQPLGKARAALARVRTPRNVTREIWVSTRAGFVVEQMCSGFGRGARRC